MKLKELQGNIRAFMANTWANVCLHCFLLTDKSICIRTQKKKTLFIPFSP